MNRILNLTLIGLPLAVETWCEFIAHDQTLVNVSAAAGLGLIVIRWLLLDAEKCPPNCPKCRESESVEEMS
jgi:hypothetical protein